MNGQSFPIIAVGASAGGLEAFSTLLRGVPDEPGFALVFIQHLAPAQRSALPSLLARSTKLPVSEALDGTPVRPNNVYVIPPNATLEIANGVLQVGPRPAGLHKPVDIFFRSLARDRKNNAVGVVLSGSDADGMEGLRAIKAVGGLTFAQDASAKFSGMPQSSISAGVADFVLPPHAIASELVRHSQEPWRQVDVDEDGGERDDEAPASGQDIGEILNILRQASAVDFAAYKQSTVRRRVFRRMNAAHLQGVEEFASFLRTNPAEVTALHNDILISVTGFFRDREGFAALESEVLIPLIDRRRADEPVRVWVPGCATGEEAYSIAISLTELLQKRKQRADIQIFGTDISAPAIAKARRAIYAQDTANEVSPERLHRFFVEVDGGYRMDQSIRDSCVFATHDLTRDPPFSRIDLVSCRNLLIYLGPTLQRRVFPVFHYALKPQGYLFLGASESVGSFASLFTPLNKRWKIYQRTDLAHRWSFDSPSMGRRWHHAIPHAEAPAEPVPNATREMNLQKEADRLLLAAYAPPGVVINEQMDVLNFRGRTAPYLEPPAGKASYNLMTMTREGLLADLYVVVREAIQQGRAIDKLAHFEVDGRDRSVLLRVAPLGADTTVAGRCFLVLFEEPPALVELPHDTSEISTSATPRPASSDEETLHLKRELATARVQLQSLVEAQEMANEELQAANEEVLSSNEELQSTNEELETSKEELQSANEELTTLNDELQGRNSDLGHTNDDLTNVLSSVSIPFVILDLELNIRRFTPAAAQFFNVIAADVGRPIGNINFSVKVPHLEKLMSEVVHDLRPLECEVQDRANHWHRLLLRPYRTSTNRIEGVVLILLDINQEKQAAFRAEAARDYAEGIVETVSYPLLVLGKDLRVRTANAAFYRLFKTSRSQAEGTFVYELGEGQWNIPALRTLLEEINPRDSQFSKFEVSHEFPSVGKRVLLLSGRRIVASGGDELILLAIDDISEDKQRETALEERDRELARADRRKNDFLAMLAHELRNPLSPIVNAVELLRRGGGDEGQRERALQIIQRQTGRMSRLIDDLLDVSRITRGKVELRREMVRLDSLIATAIEAASPLVNARGHQLVVVVTKEPLWIYGDSTRLEQVIANLLSNAVKYTDPGGRVYLTAEREGNQAVLRVKDNGVGIERDALAQIFEPFTQAEQTSDRTSGGLGIGLTIVRSLVEMHGGEVEAKSEGKGQGSEFVVRLPLHAQLAGQQAEPANDEDEIPSGQVTPRRVLVVEDLEDVAETMGALLRNWGHHVRIAADGQAALEAAGTGWPEVVLLDIGLPGMDGYEVARRLRAQITGATPFIIAITGYGQPEDRQRSTDAGIDLHVVKPVDPRKLRRILSREGLSDRDQAAVLRDPGSSR